MSPCGQAWYEPNHADVQTAFVAAGGDVAHFPNEATLKKYTKLACIFDQKELSMFFANLMQESARLSVAEEGGADNKKGEYNWGGDKSGTKCTPDKGVEASCDPLGGHAAKQKRVA